MRSWFLLLVVVSACASERESRECMGSVRWVDTGKRWRPLVVPETVIGVLNANVEAVEGGSKITFPNPGEFRVDSIDRDPCKQQRSLFGVAVERPLELPKVLIEAPSVRPGSSTSVRFVITNLTDEDFELELSSNDPQFQPMVLGGKQLPAGGLRDINVVFAPTSFGRHEARLTASIGDWSGSFEVGGFAGGPLVSAPTLIEAGAVVRGFSRPDVRTFTIQNLSASSEDEWSDLMFFGDPSINGCNGHLSMAPMPIRIPRAQSHQGMLFMNTDGVGPLECFVRLQTQKDPIEFRVRWTGIVLPPCELRVDQPVVQLDGGTGTVRITAQRESCYFTYPRFEPADAGHLDIDWSVLTLEEGSTLTIPVVADADGVVLLNSNQPTGVTRIEVKK